MERRKELAASPEFHQFAIGETGRKLLAEGALAFGGVCGPFWLFTPADLYAKEGAQHG